MACWRRRKRSAATQKDEKHAAFLPKEIISDILQRLPVEPLFKFKCVSKLWNSIISDPKFARNYLQQARSFPKHSSSSLPHLWGMLYPFVHCYYDPKRRLPMKYTADHREIFYLTSYFSRYTWSEREHKILTSSKGLVLSLFSRFDHSPKGVPLWNSKIELCVSNPLTRHFVKLPSIKCPDYRIVFGFATRASPTEGSYITYKVVVIRHVVMENRLDPFVGSTIGTVEIFSSDTGSWSGSEVIISCPRAVFQSFNKAECFCYKGILHWLDNETKTIVTYDPFDKPNEFGQIRLPDGGSGNKVEGMNLIHFDHEDLVKYCEIDTVQSSMLVWRLVDYDKGEWWQEQHCWIHPLCYDKCKQLVAPDPLKSSLFCYLYARDSVVSVVDLGRGHIARVNMSSIIRGAPTNFHMHSLVPIVFCPWSDPFYGQGVNELRPRFPSSL